MLRALFALLGCMLTIGAGAQEEIPQKASAEDLKIYPFDGKYINLNSFERYELEELPALTFKSASKYAARFRGLAIDRLVFKGKMFEVQPNNGLLFTDLSTRAAQPLPNREKGLERYGQNFLIEGADGMVYIKYLNSDNGFKIYKYDAQANEKIAVTLAHSELVERPNLKYYRPFLNYFAHTQWQLVFTSYMKSKEKTYIVELSDGKVLEYDFTIQGIIRDEKDDSFIFGFVQLDKKTGKLKITYRSDVFELEVPALKGLNQVETVLKGDQLLLAAYNERASGAELLSIDIKQHLLQWEASLKMPSPQPASNSNRYYNKVWLSSYQDKVVLEGMEPDLKYLQIIDLQTGKLLKSFGL